MSNVQSLGREPGRARCLADFKGLGVFFCQGIGSKHGPGEKGSCFGVALFLDERGDNALGVGFIGEGDAGGRRR